MVSAAFSLFVKVLSAASLEVADTPIDFRCDGMQLDRANGRHTCQGNVIIRQDDVLLCCQELEGIADAEGRWLTATCRGDVRLRRADDLAWADEAVYRPERRQLVLQGTPLLRRGASVMLGERILVNLDSTQVHITAPRGHVQPESISLAGTAPAVRVPLPTACPLAAARRRP